MVPGTDRYRESRVERQGGDEERGKATAKSREKKRKGGGRWSGVGGFGKELGECGCRRVEVSQREKTGGRVRWSVWKEEGEKRTSKSNKQTQP